MVATGGMLRRVEETKPAVQLQQEEDPLMALARAWIDKHNRPIGEGESVSIPHGFRGKDPTTGEIRSTYAAKRHLKHLTWLMLRKTGRHAC